MLSLPEAKKELVELASQGRLIVFVGSGISVDSGLPAWEGFLDAFIGFCKEISANYRSYDVQSIFQNDLFVDAVLQKTKKPTHVATVLKAKISELPQHIRTNVENDFRRWFYGMFVTAVPNRKHEIIARTNYPYSLLIMTHSLRTPQKV